MRREFHGSSLSLRGIYAYRNNTLGFAANCRFPPKARIVSGHQVRQTAAHKRAFASANVRRVCTPSRKCQVSCPDSIAYVASLVWEPRTRKTEDPTHGSNHTRKKHARTPVNPPRKSIPLSAHAIGRKSSFLPERNSFGESLPSRPEAIGEWATMRKGEPGEIEVN